MKIEIELRLTYFALLGTHSLSSLSEVPTPAQCKLGGNFTDTIELLRKFVSSRWYHSPSKLEEIFKCNFAEKFRKPRDASLRLNPRSSTREAKGQNTKLLHGTYYTQNNSCKVNIIYSYVHSRQIVKPRLNLI